MAGVVNTTYTFTATDLVTSTKLNNLIDETIFTSDAITGTTLEVTGLGKLRVATGGVTSNELGSNSVTSVKITDAAVTPAKLSAYGPQWNNNSINFGQGTSESSYIVQIAPIRGANGAASVYFGAQTGVSNNASISRASGVNGAFSITNTGSGNFNITNGSGGAMELTNGNALMKFTAYGAVQLTLSGTYATFTGECWSPAYHVSSDYRLKSNITALDDQLSAVLALRPVSYTLSAAPRLGLIAHEVQEHFPEAVRGEKDAVDEDGQPIYQAIEYTALIPALISAIQSQQRQIDELKNAR